MELNAADRNTLNGLIEALRGLHRRIDGPYDDYACEYCTGLILRHNSDYPELRYQEFPCPTIQIVQNGIKF